jgi:hypothetical protein
MIHIGRMMGTVCRAVVFAGLTALAGLTAFADTASAAPVFDTSSSGLITFSSQDMAIRVAVVFAVPDEAVVPTTVRFLDAQGNVLKQQRGELRDGQPVVVELTRQDVVPRGDLLVRVQVVHKLPAIRDRRYPITVTAQPIAPGGFGRFVLDWGTGTCGCPSGYVCGPPPGHGAHLMCAAPAFVDM